MIHHDTTNANNDSNYDHAYLAGTAIFGWHDPDVHYYVIL